MAEVPAHISVRLPRLYRLRWALALLLLGWTASLIAGILNGIEVEVE